MSTKALYVHNPMPPLPGQVTLNNFEIGSGCGGKVIYNDPEQGVAMIATATHCLPFSCSPEECSLKSLNISLIDPDGKKGKTFLFTEEQLKPLVDSDFSIVAINTMDFAQPMDFAKPMRRVKFSVTENFCKENNMGKGTKNDQRRGQSTKENSEKTPVTIAGNREEPVIIKRRERNGTKWSNWTSKTYDHLRGSSPSYITGLGCWNATEEIYNISNQYIYASSHNHPVGILLNTAELKANFSNFNCLLEDDDYFPFTCYPPMIFKSDSGSPMIGSNEDFIGVMSLLWGGFKPQPQDFGYPYPQAGFSLITFDFLNKSLGPYCTIHMLSNAPGIFKTIEVTNCSKRLLSGHRTIETPPTPFPTSYPTGRPTPAPTTNPKAIPTTSDNKPNKTTSHNSKQISIEIQIALGVFGVFLLLCLIKSVLSKSAVQPAYSPIENLESGVTELDTDAGERPTDHSTTTIGEDENLEHPNTTGAGAGAGAEADAAIIELRQLERTLGNERAVV